MPTDFITKRPHKKSRGGCKTCKTRKIKCDEAQPRCSFCEKRDLTCDYNPRTIRALQTPPQTPGQSSSSVISIALSEQDEDSLDFSDLSSALTTISRAPTPSVPTKSGFLSQLDLRAMHFWSLFTSQTITGDFAVTCLQVTVPQLAFENDYLLNVMLGISSLHMQSLTITSDEKQQELTLYRAKAFAGFRKALAKLDSTKRPDWEAALITSILLTLLCAKDYKVEDGDLIVLNWLTLYRGLSSVIQMRNFEEVMDSAVSPIFRRSINDLLIEPIVPYKLYEMLESITPSDPDFPYLRYFRKILDLLGVLYASLLQDGLSVAFSTRVVGWCSLTGKEFTALAKEKRPRAIILLAHYMVFLKAIKSVWWADGVGHGDIQRVFKMLPPKWFPYLDVPRQALNIDEPEDLRFLLLCSVDEKFAPVLKTSVADYEEAVRWFAPSSDTGKYSDEC